MCTGCLMERDGQLYNAPRVDRYHLRTFLDVVLLLNLWPLYSAKEWVASRYDQW